jgi:hypothetical protein
MKIQEILEIKATIIEVVKDSPLIAYMAFYEPLHNWMSSVADGWDSVAKFILNIVMAVYGILRIIAIVKGWKNEEKEDNENSPD